MRNAEEHKKLLAQIAELEKNSTNYFDVEKEFFLIDSNNLAEVKTRFYGYSIQATGIYEEDNLTEDAVANLDGRGCYVYVEAKDGKITIKQDLNGCWGIYLFRHGDYFALSNSFFRLLDHIKYRYPLTVNRDYCHYLWIEALCSNAYSETAVNEVKLLDRSAVIHMDIAEKSFRIKQIDYKEHSISPDTKEGLAVLDNWIDLWSKVFRGLSKNTKFIQADLSGGFDSRLSLITLLSSGIDLSKVRIYSATDGLHTHTEDYEIASKIANHYGFKLNQSLPSPQVLNYSLADVFNLNLYTCQTFTNIPSLWPQKTVDKIFHLNGAGGETLRFTWARFESLDKFIKTRVARTHVYSSALAQKLSYSTDKILNSAFRDIGRRYGIENNIEMILQYLVQETQCRNHFGKLSVSAYIKNTLQLSPALDPQLRKVRYNSPEFKDYNLLVALIFTRYAPELLTFPFERKRSLATETIEYAKKINERFPRRLVTNEVNSQEKFHLTTSRLTNREDSRQRQKNPNIPSDLPLACLKTTFESSKTFGLFTMYFDEELYHYAADFYDTHVFGRYRPMYAIMGVAKVLENVEISQRNQPLYQDIKRFLEQDFGQISADDNAEIIRKFKGYFTARIDVNLLPTTQGELQILSMSDRKATSFKASWLPQSQSGYFIQSYVGNLEIVAKPASDGQLFLYLRGTDTRKSDDKSKRIPCWIDYTKLTVNGKVIFNHVISAWHDKPFIHKMDVKADEEIKIQVEWQPHRSDT